MMTGSLEKEKKIKKKKEKKKAGCSVIRACSLIRSNTVCINSGNDHVINDHLQAKNTSAGRAPHYVITTTRVENQNSFDFFLPDTLAVRLIGSSFTFNFASSSCRIYKFISSLCVT